MKTLNYEILGDAMQQVDITLEPGKAVRAESGGALYLENGIDMQTNAEGGFMGGLKRAFAGESFFVPIFTNNGSANAVVSFAAPYPGKVLHMDLEEHAGTMLCQRDSFLCADKDIEIGIEFTKKLKAGFFGGEGFILQKLTGSGSAFVHAGGNVVKKVLKAGESLRVDTGCIVAFESTVTYDIQFIGGFKNVLFGGEGLFWATLTGPGTVFLQSLPFSKMADRIIAAVGRPKEQGGFTFSLGNN